MMKGQCGMAIAAFFRLIFILAFVFLSIKFIAPKLDPVDLPEPTRETSKDGCVVSEEEAKVHSGSKGYETAWIQFVNDDGTIQIQTIDTKLTLLFKPRSEDIPCFHKGYLVPVTIDFNMPNIVYIRSRPVKIVVGHIRELN